MSMNNLTPRAGQVLELARAEARRLNHPYVNTEHLLLGLINLGEGVAVKVLEQMSIDLDAVRIEVEKQTVPTATNVVERPSNTPRAKYVFALADREAEALNHSWVGTEHVLLGLLREGGAVAGGVLKSFGVEIEQTSRHIVNDRGAESSRVVRAVHNTAADRRK